MLGLYRATLNFTSYTRLITTINRNDILQSATGLLQILIFWTLLEHFHRWEWLFKVIAKNIKMAIEIVFLVGLYYYVKKVFFIVG